MFDIQPTLYPSVRSTLLADDEVRAKKCAAKISYLMIEAQRRMDLRLRSQIDAADAVAVALWDRIMANLYCRMDFLFIFDEPLMNALIIGQEGADTFVFGESEFDKYKIGVTPPSQRLSDCYFYPQHFDYENVSCIRIKFMESTMTDIRAEIADYYFQCGRTAQFFQMVRSAEARIRSTPISSLGTMRFFGFFSTSNQNFSSRPAEGD